MERTSMIAKKNNAVTEYMAGGLKVTLSPATVKSYLVSGDAAKVTDQEVMMYIGMCKANGLNPFNKDCYLIKYGSSPATQVIAKAAFMRRAEANPSFDGFEAGVVVYTGESIEHRQGCALYEGETLLGGWARVYRKDRSRPMYEEVSLSEYNKKQSMWNTAPATMIRKVALTHALREAFPADLEGLYVAEELNVKEPDAVADYREVPAEQPAPSVEDDDPFSQEGAEA